MKKINVFYLFTCLIAALLFSCTEQDDAGSSSRTVDVNLELSVSDMVQTKADALGGDDGIDDSDDVPYCLKEKASFDAYDQVYAKYILSTDAPGSDPHVLTWNVAATGDYSQLSHLIQIDFPAETESIQLTFVDFKVYAKDVDPATGTPKFVVPYVNSAYAGYVSEPIDPEGEEESASFTIGVYEKKYMKMEVLCFNYEDIPLFGFAWTDFEVVYGDEVYFFFNCLGETAMTRHQVLPLDIRAYFKPADGKEWVEYWVGSNYEMTKPLDIKPFAVPCPGNWKDYGMKLNIKPLASADSFDIELSVDLLKDAISQNPEKPYQTDFSDYSVSVDYSEDYSADDNGDDYFIHYTMKDCGIYKPKAYYTNGISGEATIYAMSWTGDQPAPGNFVVTELFEQDGGIHIAMSPDKTKLVLVDRGETNNLDPLAGEQGASFFVYDIFALTWVRLTPEDTPGAMMPDYDFTQLVYVDDKLYAGCMENNCLVPVEIDYIKNTYYLGSDVINEANKPGINGGDLIGLEDGEHIVSLSKTNNSYLYYDLTGGMTSGYEIGAVSGLGGVSGACTTPYGDIIVSTYTSSSNLNFTLWTPSGTVDLGNGGIDETNGGDMASAFEGITYDQFKKIFGEPDSKYDGDGIPLP